MATSRPCLRHPRVVSRARGTCPVLPFPRDGHLEFAPKSQLPSPGGPCGPASCRLGMKTFS